MNFIKVFALSVIFVKVATKVIVGETHSTTDALQKRAPEMPNDSFLDTLNKNSLYFRTREIIYHLVYENVSSLLDLNFIQKEKLDESVEVAIVHHYNNIWMPEAQNSEFDMITDLFGNSLMYVRDYITKKIKNSTLETYKNLKISHVKIKEIPNAGIRYFCPNNLSLENTGISDIINLDAIGTINSLNISHNRFITFPTLSKHPNIQKICVSYNPIFTIPDNLIAGRSKLKVVKAEGIQRMHKMKSKLDEISELVYVDESPNEAKNMPYNDQKNKRNKSQNFLNLQYNIMIRIQILVLLWMEEWSMGNRILIAQLQLERNTIKLLKQLINEQAEMNCLKDFLEADMKNHLDSVLNKLAMNQIEISTDAWKQEFLNQCLLILQLLMAWSDQKSVIRGKSVIEWHIRNPIWKMSDASLKYIRELVNS